MTKVIPAIVLCLLMSTAAFAQTRISILVSSVEYQGETTADTGEEVDLDMGSGFGLTLSHQWTPRLGGELAIFQAGTTAALQDETEREEVGNLDIMPVSLAALWSFNPGGGMSPYLTAGAAYVVVDDVESDALRQIGIERFQLSNEVAPMIGAGLNIRITERAAIRFDARYFDLDTEATTPQEPEEVTDVHLDPVFLSLGFQWTF